MTDITELAQRMRTAAEKAGIEQWVNNRGEVNTADYEVDGGMYIDHICDCEIVGTESPRAEFIALVNPANILALVEALELKEEQRANWSQMAQKLGEELDAAEKRIAELGSRKPDIYLCRVTRNGEELYSPCGADYPRGTGYHRSVTVESRTVTVKLPDLRQVVSGDRYVWSDGVFNYSQDVKAELTAKGIKWEAE